MFAYSCKHDEVKEHPENEQAGFDAYRHDASTSNE
eukprot:SAG31_NODE_175_length_21352_cov_3.981508_21_plen_34_part_01